MGRSDALGRSYIQLTPAQVGSADGRRQPSGCAIAGDQRSARLHPKPALLCIWGVT